MKAKSIFICNQCGNETPRWQGQCPACGAWNSIVEFEDKKPAANKASSGTKLAASKPKKLRELDASDRQIRFSTGLGELDRVLGGGGVKGSLVLVGGAPGIGKSARISENRRKFCMFPARNPNSSSKCAPTGCGWRARIYMFCRKLTSTKYSARSAR